MPKHKSTPTTFRALCNNDPWVAIKAMLDGLYGSKKLKSFEVRMNSYGRTELDVCYGCAATLTIMQLTKAVRNASEVLKYGELRVEAGSEAYESIAQYLNVEPRDFDLFESRINSFRMGFTGDLSSYFDVELPEPPVWDLETSNWAAQLPLIVDYYNQHSGQPPYTPPTSFYPLAHA